MGWNISVVFELSSLAFLCMCMIMSLESQLATYELRIWIWKDRGTKREDITWCLVSWFSHLTASRNATDIAKALQLNKVRSDFVGGATCGNQRHQMLNQSNLFEQINEGNLLIEGQFPLPKDSPSPEGCHRQCRNVASRGSWEFISRKFHLFSWQHLFNYYDIYLGKL